MACARDRVPVLDVRGVGGAARRRRCQPVCCHDGDAAPRGLSGRHCNRGGYLRSDGARVSVLRALVCGCDGVGFLLAVVCRLADDPAVVCAVACADRPQRHHVPQREHALANGHGAPAPERGGQVRGGCGGTARDSGVPVLVGGCWALGRSQHHVDGPRVQAHAVSLVDGAAVGAGLRRKQHEPRLARPRDSGGGAALRLPWRRSHLAAVHRPAVGHTERVGASAVDCD
eukprot:Amastigsp_a345351_13.p3 type:complete len:229 gc:universal Amastigsp_a345351_13:860-1546(+)